MQVDDVYILREFVERQTGISRRSDDAQHTELLGLLRHAVVPAHGKVMRCHLGVSSSEEDRPKKQHSGTGRFRDKAADVPWLDARSRQPTYFSLMDTVCLMRVMAPFDNRYLKFLGRFSQLFMRWA